MNNYWNNWNQSQGCYHNNVNQPFTPNRPVYTPNQNPFTPNQSPFFNQNNNSIINLLQQLITLIQDQGQQNTPKIGAGYGGAPFFNLGGDPVVAFNDGIGIGGVSSLPTNIIPEVGAGYGGAPFFNLGGDPVVAFNK